MSLLVAVLFGALLGRGGAGHPAHHPDQGEDWRAVCSLSTFLDRVVDPNAFAFVQVASFASIASLGRMDALLLPMAVAYLPTACRQSPTPSPGYRSTSTAHPLTAPRPGLPAGHLSFCIHLESDAEPAHLSARRAYNLVNPTTPTT